MLYCWGLHPKIICGCCTIEGYMPQCYVTLAILVFWTFECRLTAQNYMLFYNCSKACDVWFTTWHLLPDYIMESTQQEYLGNEMVLSSCYMDQFLDIKFGQCNGFIIYKSGRHKMPLFGAEPVIHLKRGNQIKNIVSKPSCA